MLEQLLLLSPVTEELPCEVGLWHGGSPDLLGLTSAKMKAVTQQHMYGANPQHKPVHLLS